MVARLTAYQGKQLYHGLHSGSCKLRGIRASARRKVERNSEVRGKDRASMRRSARVQ